MKNLFLFMIAALVLTTGCKKDKHDKQSGVFKGPALNVGNGKAWSYIETDENNKPVSIGVVLSQNALTNLPNDASSHHGVSYVLSLPSEKKDVTPYDHIGMDWNPHGHEPEFIYGAPHFDFHFYMMPQAERLAIPAYEQDSVKFKNSPTPQYLPALYMNFGGGVPQMGAHWLDVTSPELNPQQPAPFTQTFIYGSYNGKVIFMEPMITKQFLDTIPHLFERNIPQPVKFQKTGYYPTKMHVQKHDGETLIVMDHFIYRQQS